MDLQMHVRDADGVTVVEVSGDLELHSAPQLREELKTHCEAGAPRVVVDLGHVPFIDSSGIGVLVGALKRARESGGALALAGTQPRVRRVFEITGLLRAIPIFDTVEAATDAVRELAGAIPEPIAKAAPQNP